MVAVLVEVPVEEGVCVGMFFYFNPFFPRGFGGSFGVKETNKGIQGDPFPCLYFLFLY